VKKTKQQQTVEPAGADKIINPSDLLVIYCNSVYTEPVFQSVVGVITPHHPADHPLKSLHCRKNHQCF
jgi:hypothetical protein